MNKVRTRVVQLLADAREARQAGDLTSLRALAGAVTALDPGNAEAQALLVGAARRRQMTLLFCDIVNSTAIADARDPEEMSRILRAYRELCSEIVGRHLGVIEDNQGDGMLVLFGYPDVTEDDAQRAVRCSLEIVSSIRSWSVGDAAKIQVRIAVHTDLVMLDGVGVAGATANEAARIQSLAEPNSVVISDATESIVRGWFKVASHGKVELRGVSRPVEVFTVLSERPRGRRESGTPPSPFTGRRMELERIMAAWGAMHLGWQETVVDRDASWQPGLLVRGLPGVGKTRLLLEAASGVGGPCAKCACSRYHDNTSLYPFVGLLETACGIVDCDDDPVRRLAKLRRRLDEDDWQNGDLPFLAAALGIPASMVSPPPEVDARQLRDTSLQVAARLILAWSANSPSMLFIDDLQWADRSTLDLLQILLTTRYPGLLILLAARENFEPPWPESLVATLDLGPLTDLELQELAGRLLVDSQVPPEQRAELVSRSDGMPLFLEELIRTAEAVDERRVIHRSTRFSEFSIPAALLDPLLARLTSPGVDLALTQIAASIGRDVDGDLLRRTAGITEPALETKLRSLVVADLVEQVSPGSLRFRHELIREVAYETQPRNVRIERHSDIADHLLADAAVQRRIDAGSLTFHLVRANRFQEAIGVNLRAAQADQEIGGHAEATRRLTETLSLLDRLPVGDARDQTELAVRELRSFSAVMASGYAANEAAQDYRRCVELCEQAGMRPELLPSLIRSWSYFTFRGDLGEADRISERIEAAGEDELATLIARSGRGVTAFFEGRFPEARRSMEAFVEHPWSDTAGRPPFQWPLPNDPLASACGLLVPALWIDGRRDEAWAMGERALRRAETLAFPYGPFTVGYIKSLQSLTRRIDGDHDAAGRIGTEMIWLGERHGFAMWALAGSIQKGLSEVYGAGPGAMAKLTADVSIWRTLLVADLWSSYWLTELACAQAAIGEVDSALQSLDDAVAISEATGACFYIVETFRLRGEVRCRLGDSGGMADIRHARDLAIRQEAMAFVSRAEESLGRTAIR